MSEATTRDHQSQQHQPIAISSQVVPMCREVMIAADQFAYDADNGDTPDLEELARLLEEASDELDELASLASDAAQ